MSLTHEDLRRRAVKWLTNAKRCSVVLSEIVTGAYENPDAVGWCRGGTISILIECKISRSDFFRNGGKISCRTGKLVGNQRYFMTPDKLVNASDMEAFPEYGLIYASEYQSRIIIDAPLREPDRKGEIIMLVSALRRVRTREFLTINTCDHHEDMEAACGDCQSTALPER